MTDDLVERLRHPVWTFPEAEDISVPDTVNLKTMLEAVDEIERLRAEVDIANQRGDAWRDDIKPRCRTESPHSRFWECERPVGHEGPHVAPIDHVEWDQEEK
jgi:hypothetical protein